MSLSNWSLPAEGTKRIEKPAPALALPEQAGGMQGERLVIVQVGISMSRGSLRGVSMDGAIGMIRLAVTRIVEIADPEASPEITLGETRTEWVQGGYEDVLYRRRIGKAHEDVELRPEGRVSLVIRKAGPAMPANVRPLWKAALLEVMDGVRWASGEAAVWRGNQYALLLACDLQGVRRVVPKDTRYAEFTEANVTMIRSAEVVKLTDEAAYDLPERAQGDTPQDENEDDEVEVGTRRLRIG